LFLRGESVGDWNSFTWHQKPAKVRKVNADNNQGSKGKVIPLQGWCAPEGG